MMNDPAGKSTPSAEKAFSAILIGTLPSLYRNAIMLFEPKCATASPAVPLPTIFPFRLTSLTRVVASLRTAGSAISFTSTIISRPIVQPLSS